MAEHPPPNAHVVTNLLTTQSSLIQTLSSFVTVVVHQVLALRNIYPPVSFVSTRAYNYPVRQSRHPAVCEWINDAVAMVRDQLAKNVLSNIAVCIFECDNNRVLERWVLDLHSFPVVDRREKDTPFARNDLDNDGVNETLLRKSVNVEDLDAQFRAILSRLSVSAAKMASFPFGDDVPELSFTITMEVRDNADRPVGRRNEPEQGWIAAEPQAFTSVTDNNLSDVKEHKKQDGKTIPVRRLEAGELRIEVWAEESKAKFELITASSESSQPQSNSDQRFDPDLGYALEPPDINRPQPPNTASHRR